MTGDGNGGDGIPGKPGAKVIYGSGGAGAETQFILRDDGARLYSPDEVVNLLQRAADMGLPLAPGTFLEGMTIQQLDALVGDRARGD